MINKTVLGLVDKYQSRVMSLYLVQVMTLLIHVLMIKMIVELMFGGGSLQLMVLLIVMKLALTMLSVSIRNGLSRYVKADLRFKLFDKMKSYVLDRSAMVQMSSEGIEQIDLYFSNYLPQFIYAMSAPLLLFAVIAKMHMGVGLLLLVMVPMIPVSIVFVQKFAKKLLKKHYGDYLHMGNHFLESVEGLSTLKHFDVDEQQQTLIDTEAESFRKTTMLVLLMQLNSISVMDLIAYGGAAMAVVLIVGAYTKGSITLQQGLVMILLSAEYFIPMRILGSFFHVSMNGVSAGVEMAKYLDHEAIAEVIINGAIQLTHADFYYGERRVLHDMSFDVKPGEFIGIAGVSGCGKSTLMKILTRDVEHTLPVMSKDDLIKLSVSIDYSAKLFTGTLRDNLLMGCMSASDDELMAVLGDVNLVDLSLDLLIDPNSSNLSGGQKQRIALARALLKDAEIYFFDEITSNVDSDSEQVILASIMRLHKHGKTIVMISHRLTNLSQCDRIYYLDKGCVVGCDTLSNLVEENEGFNKLYQSQFALEEGI